MNAHPHWLRGGLARWSKQHPAARPRSARSPRLALERLEDRTVPSVHPPWRLAIAPSPRSATTSPTRPGHGRHRPPPHSPAAYADGISSPSLPNNPSARVISDLLNNQADPGDPVAGPQHRQCEQPVRLRLRLGPVHRPRHGPHPDRPEQHAPDPRRPQRPEPDGQPDVRPLRRPTRPPAPAPATRPAGQRRHLVPRPVAGLRFDRRPWPTPCAPTPAASSRPAPATCCPTTTAPTSRLPSSTSSTWPTTPGRARPQTVRRPATCAATRTSS